MAALINVEKTATCLAILQNKILTCLTILQNKILTCLAILQNKISKGTLQHLFIHYNLHTF
jgi:hypothetical protein